MNTFLWILVVFILFGALVYLAKLLFDAKVDLQRYSSIADVERHRKFVLEEAETTQLEIKKIVGDVGNKQAELEELQKQIESTSEFVELETFGFYKANYEFGSSEEYAERLQEVRNGQKKMIKDESATHCPRDWLVDGSEVKGRKMVKEHRKLMLRAFNGECDAAIAKIKYNNANSLESRIERSFEAINKLGKSKEIDLDERYLKLKFSELRLVHEHSEKIQEEREEQRRIKEQMREEQKVEKEIGKAMVKAEEEELLRHNALEKARLELAESTGKQHQKLEELVTKLEQELSTAIDRKAKAVARAQLTKSGHVYVLSNVGSFGKNVYKIGLTRRLEPLERVKELGAASVPFKFDVHAMIYSENAVELENAFHKEFSARRVNKVNMRREYFRLTLDEIRHAATRLHGTVTFVTVPKAEELRKTLAIERETKTASAKAG